METDEKVNKILTDVSDIFGVEVRFVQTEDEGKVRPSFNVDAVISKMIALFVYSGLNVPSSFAPPYNRVHADVEWWKNKFNEIKNQPEEETKTLPDSGT